MEPICMSWANASMEEEDEDDDDGDEDDEINVQTDGVANAVCTNPPDPSRTHSARAACRDCAGEEKSALAMGEGI